MMNVESDKTMFSQNTFASEGDIQCEISVVSRWSKSLRKSFLVKLNDGRVDIGTAKYRAFMRFRFADTMAHIIVQ